MNYYFLNFLQIINRLLLLLLLLLLSKPDVNKASYSQVLNLGMDRCCTPCPHKKVPLSSWR